MEGIQGSCKITLVKDHKLGWKIIADGNCGKLEEVIEDLPTRKAQYLKRRVDYVTSPSEVSSTSSLYSSSSRSEASPISENPSG